MVTMHGADQDELYGLAEKEVKTHLTGEKFKVAHHYLRLYVAIGMAYAINGIEVTMPLIDLFTTPAVPERPFPHQWIETVDIVNAMEDRLLAFESLLFSVAEWIRLLEGSHLFSHKLRMHITLDPGCPEMRNLG